MSENSIIDELHIFEKSLYKKSKAIALLFNINVIKNPYSTVTDLAKLRG